MFNNIKFEYLSIKEVSKVTGIDERTLRRRCEKGKYQTRKIQTAGGKNGLKYEILFSSLEPELQHKFLLNSNVCDCGGYTPFLTQTAPVFLDSNRVSQVSCKTALKANNIATGGFSLNKIIPEKAKKIAAAKASLVALWQDYAKDKKNKTKANNEFMVLYNNGVLSKEFFKLLGTVSQRSLYRWQKTLNINNNDYHSLIDNYNYTGESQLKSSLSDNEKQDFIQLYYNDAKLNLQTTYNLLKYKYDKVDHKIKSLSTYRRFADFIKQNFNDFNVLSREGEKALKDKVAPYLRRDISSLKAGDALVADGNKLDFMVISPYTGKPVRATWVVYLDWVSFDVAGSEIMLSENTQSISSALRNSIIRLGKIPKFVYMDNGRAFRGKFFTGTKSLFNCGFIGIYNSLGITTQIAKAYNGRAKVVERFFQNFVKSCPPCIDSYIGNCINNQPAHNKRNEKFHKELHKNDVIPTIEQAKIIIEEWLKFYRSQPCPHDKTKSIENVFNSGVGSGVDIDMLDELMMATEIRTARKNTIKLFGLEYTTPKLYGKTGKFLIKYSHFDISQIKIYSQKGEYIGNAKTVVPVNPFAKHLGDANDLYTYKMQLKQQNELIQGTIQNAKLIMSNTKPFENLPWGNMQNIHSIEEKRTAKNKIQKKKKLEITCFENTKQATKKELII